MSIWMDESADDRVDEPLAVKLDEADAEADDLLAPVGDGEDWTPDQGYPDSSLSVRIWVDEHKQLTKVRISNRWRDRAKGTSLSSMFDEAFLLANASIGSPLPVMEDADEPVPSDYLSWESLDGLVAELDHVADEEAALDALPSADVVPSRWVGQVVEGHSANKMVAVRISIQGKVDKVAFSDAWLRQARVSEVCQAVMEAYRDGYARFVPPVYEPGDRQRLADKYRRLQNMSMALMRRGPIPQGGSR